jgi:hypothetical protein
MNRMLLVLQRAPKQETALRKLLDQQQTKSSPNFHKWLTPEQFGEQFGPADADIQAVTDWLTTQGFEVNRVAAGRTVIEFSGTAGLLRQALHTEIHKYVVNGEEHWANASDPQIPAALAPVVAGIASLHNFRRKPSYHPVGTFERSKATGRVRPLFTYSQNGFTAYAVGPGDFATIYNVGPLWTQGIDGTGQSIAVVAQSNINPQDVADFRQMFGLPAARSTNPNIILNGSDPGVLASDESEAALDTEWSGAVAKGATINLVVSESTESSAGVDLSALYIVDNNLAPVLGDSYLGCEVDLQAGGDAFYNALWEQAAAQGITVSVASGDNGSAACDGGGTPPPIAAQGGLAVSGLASTPFNVAVGGTDFDQLNNFSLYWNATNNSTSQASAKGYIPEIPWDDSLCAQNVELTNCNPASDGSDLVGGGGGPSNKYPKPAWQTGPGVPDDRARDLPDVSLFAGLGANGSFYVFCQMDANTGAGSSTSSCDLNAPYADFQGAGGTSFSAQAFAGIMALVNQKTNQRQGNANYVFYPLAAAQNAGNCNSSSAPGSNCNFYDVTKSNNSVACYSATRNCSATGNSGFGIIVEPNSSTPAWPAGAAYDLASGLGSVNVANLVNNWASVSFKPTTSALSLSPTTLTHGQSVNVNISVSSLSGTPTGAASLLGSPNFPTPGIGSFQLANGSYSGATSQLPGGTYSVTAHYAGDGTFGASDSSPVQVTVKPESSETQVALVTFDQSGYVTSSNATTAPYGSPYSLRVDVKNAAANVCTPWIPGGQQFLPVSGCPTGTVTVTDNGNQLPASDEQGAPPGYTPGTYRLNSQGYLEDIYLQLPVGSHPLKANYQGDSSFQASSGSDAITITLAATTISLTASPTTVGAVSDVTLKATVSTASSGATPTGNAQFSNGGNAIISQGCTGTAGGTSSGAYATCQATLIISALPVGTDSLTAQYLGDQNYAQSPVSSPVEVNVVPDFNLAANPTSSTISPGQSATSTITVYSGKGFTSTVNFTCAVPLTMAESTCSFSTSSVTTSGNTMVTITTTAPHTIGGMTYRPGDHPSWFVTGAAASLLCILLLAIPTRRRRIKLAFASLVLALAATGFVGCGGGSGSGGGGTTDPGTPAGTYNVTVTGTTVNLSHMVSVSVTVQ